MKKKLSILLFIALTIILTSCSNKLDSNDYKTTTKSAETTIRITEDDDSDSEPPTVTEEDTLEQETKITIENKSYNLILEDNNTAKEFAKALPIFQEFTELNGNEKYCYLENPLPTNAESIGKINKGDVMLFGDDCLVIFYKTFNTPYSYTKIGHIENMPDLSKENLIIKIEQSGFSKLNK
jgi:hypothetical protein